MMNLYLKYRPRTIDELDLTSVRESLQKLVSGNKLGHAYLFTGPRGAGKTSAARILARVVNCEKNEKKLGEPCNECTSCKSILDSSAMDVIEIDAASNRGIDDVRELKEKIGLSPSALRKKVYIIDEVHMMTTEAFNALLKTLEEPPEHAVFILCTTEAHKVPETIASRCMRILFTKATREEMIRSFTRVVKGEKAKVSKEALSLLASSVDGSFRDGVKILDQVLDGEAEIGVEEMERVLHGSSGYSVTELAEALTGKDLSLALSKFREGVEQGVELMHVIVSLIGELREAVLAGQTELVELVVELDEVARKLSTSPVPEILMEMVIVSWCTDKENPKSQTLNPKPSSAKGYGRAQQAPKSNDQTTEKIANQQNNATTQQQNNKLTQQHINATTDEVKKVTKSAPVEESVFAGNPRDLWRKMLVSMNGDSYSLGALLAKARPGLIQGDELTIEVSYDFHRDQIMMEKHRAKIEKLISGVVGQPMRISCEVREDILPDKQVSLQTGEEEDTILDEAVEIFTN